MPCRFPNSNYKSLAVCGTSAEFTIALRKSIDGQLRMPFTRESYFAELSSINKKYTTNDILKLSTYHHKDGDQKIFS